MPIIQNFGGIVPRTPWHLLRENEATVAHDVKLRNSKVQAWRERKAVDMAVNDAKTLYYKGCYALTWAECVTVAEYVTDYGRLFLTGRVDQPETMVLDDCIPTYYFLGVPAPVSAPTVSATEKDGRDCSSRSYMYTYVNIFGEESAPSPISTSVTVKDGDPVVVSNMALPPDGYGITEIWIYRTATAYREDHTKEQEPATDFLKVAEIQLPTNSYTDTLKEMYLGPVCNTREVRVPPKNLRYIRYMRGTGVLTGVTDNEVHFSAAFQPYNWPAEYDMTLPYNIVHMVTVDSTVFVSTDGYPYVIDGGPSCEPRKCRNTEEADIPLPDIACGYPNSAIATPFGMVYSSKDGLVLVMPNAKFQIITSQWFSTDDWIKIRPDTVRLAYWRGYLICVTDIISFMLEIDGDTYTDFRLGALSTISDQPVDMVTTSTGELMMLETDRLIYQWNAGDTLRPYIWESRELSFGGKASPTTAKVRTQGTLFKLLTPHPDLAYACYIHDEEPVRLGRVGRHLNYRVGLYGTGDVDYVDIGMTEMTVNSGR